MSPVLVRGVGGGSGGWRRGSQRSDAIVASVNPKSVNSPVLQAVRSADTLLAGSHRVSLTSVRTMFAEEVVAAGA